MIRYKIEKICGDWAIYEVRETETEGGERCRLILNSRSNAEYIKAILEHEARYPNAAVPYRPEVAQMSDEEVLAIFRLCADRESAGCDKCPLKGKDVCFEVIDRRVLEMAERWVELTKKAKEEPGREAEIVQMARDVCHLFVPVKVEQELRCKEWDSCLNHHCDVAEDCGRLYDAGWRRQSEWISVDERLPDESACYLVNIVNHFGLDFVTFTHYTKCYGWGVPDVTHWMPLPQPPMMKGGADDGPSGTPVPTEKKEEQ